MQSTKDKRAAALDRRREELALLQAGDRYADGSPTTAASREQKIAAAQKDIANLEKKLGL